MSFQRGWYLPHISFFLFGRLRKTILSLQFESETKEAAFLCDELVTSIGLCIAFLILRTNFARPWLQQTKLIVCSSAMYTYMRHASVSASRSTLRSLLFIKSDTGSQDACTSDVSSVAAALRGRAHAARDTPRPA